MKKLLLLISVVLTIQQTFSQALNDDCSTAKYLGDIRNSQGTFFCLNGTNRDAGVNLDSNTLATPSTPYLFSTYCQDSNSIANDVWYKILLNNEIHIDLFNNDSPKKLHLNFYKGASCANLQFLNCVATTSNYLDVFKFGNNAVGDTLYMQVSGDSIGDFLRFGMCIYTCHTFCSGVTITYSTADTTCFASSVAYAAPTSQSSNDGYVHITTAWSVGTVSFLWNDGDTSSQRNNLSLGTYSVKMTDVNGCQKRDTFNFQTPLAVNELAGEALKVNYASLSRQLNVTTTTKNPASRLDLFNSVGQKILTIPIGQNTVSDLTPLADGLYIYSVSQGNQLLQTGKFVKH